MEQQKLRLKNYIKNKIEYYSMQLEALSCDTENFDMNKVQHYVEILNILREIERICIIRNKF